MYELKSEELMQVDGGNNLGNTLLFVGGTIIAVTSGGAPAVVAGIGVAALGLISSWE